MRNDVADIRPVLAILFDPVLGERLEPLRGRHPGARVILLTTPEAAPRLAGLADEVWTDGAARGPARFLALVRRMSWAHIGHVYDFEASVPTRFMRLCVWPRPQWLDGKALGHGGKAPDA